MVITLTKAPSKASTGYALINSWAHSTWHHCVILSPSGTPSTANVVKGPAQGQLIQLAHGFRIR